MEAHRISKNDPGECERFRDEPDATTPILHSAKMNTKWKLPRRYVQAMMGFLCFFIVFWMRSNYSEVAINDYYFEVNLTGERMHDLKWAAEQSSLLKHTFSWAFAAAQIPAALLVITFSGRRMLSAIVGSFSIGHIILFLIFTKHPTGVLVVRAFQGLAMAGIYSATIEIWRHWAAPSERNTLLVIMLSGEYFGNFLGFAMCMILMNLVQGIIEFNCIFGAVGLLCCLLWTILTYERPSSHPWIAQSEFTFLEESLKHDDKSKIALKTIPWLRVFTSPPVVALCLISICYNWCSTLIFTYFLFAIETFPGITVSWPVASFPQFIMGVMILIGGYISDKILSKTSYSPSQIRKSFCSGGLTLTAVLMLVPSFISGYKTISDVIPLLGIVGIGLASLFLGLVLSGFFVNALDLSPQYGSLVMAYCVMWGTVVDIILTYAMEMTLNNSDDISLRSWFVGTSILCFLGSIVYVILGSAEKQSWSDSLLPEYSSKGNASDATLYPSGAENSNTLKDDK